MEEGPVITTVIIKVVVLEGVACTDRLRGAGLTGQVNSKAMRNLFDAYDDNKDGNIDEGSPLLLVFIVYSNAMTLSAR